MAKKTAAQPKKQETKKTNEEYVWAVGRRKRAVARVRLHPKQKKGNNLDITVNDKPVGQYFTDPAAPKIYGLPLELTKTIERFTVTVKVNGSGLNSQMAAMMHGVARALVKVDEEFKPVLRANGFITRDPREKQKRMIGQGGKARAKKQSPKR